MRWKINQSIEENRQAELQSKSSLKNSKQQDYENYLESKKLEKERNDRENHEHIKDLVLKNEEKVKEERNKEEVKFLNKASKNELKNTLIRQILEKNKKNNVDSIKFPEVKLV